MRTPISNRACGRIIRQLAATGRVVLRKSSTEIRFSYTFVGQSHRVLWSTERHRRLCVGTESTVREAAFIVNRILTGRSRAADIQPALVKGAAA